MIPWKFITGLTVFVMLCASWASIFQIQEVSSPIKPPEEKPEFPISNKEWGTRGSQIENLDVTDTTHGTFSDLNDKDDGNFVRLKKGNVLTATMSDHTATGGTIISTTITVQYSGENGIGGTQLIQAWDSANGVAFCTKEYTSSSEWTEVTLDCPDVDTWKEVDNLQVKITNKDKGKPQKSYIDFIDVDVEYEESSVTEPIEVGTTGQGYTVEAGRNIARDSSGTWYVFYHDGTLSYSAYLAASDDTKPTSFTSTKLTNTGGIVNPIHTTKYGAIFIDKNDIAHIVYVDKSSTPDHVWYSQCDLSTGWDDPADWTHADGITQGAEQVENMGVGGYEANDPQVVVHDNGEISIVWAKDGIHYRRWNGDVWMEKETLSTADWAVRPNPTIDRDDNVHVVWREDKDEYNVMYSFRKATTGSWRNLADTAYGKEIVYDSSLATNKYPSITVDENGVVWVTYSVGEASGSRIYYTKGTIGTGWDTNALVPGVEGDYEAQLGLLSNNNPFLIFKRFLDYGDVDIHYTTWNGASWDTPTALDTTGSNNFPRVERYSRFGSIGFVYTDSETTPQTIFFNKVTIEDPIEATPIMIQTDPAEISQFDLVEFQVRWTHDHGLEAFRFGWDESGSWVYDPWISEDFHGNDAWSIATKTVTAAPGTYVSWNMEVRDLAQNVWETGPQTFTVSEEPPPLNLDFVLEEIWQQSPGNYAKFAKTYISDVDNDGTQEILLVGNCIDDDGTRNALLRIYSLNADTLILEKNYLWKNRGLESRAWNVYAANIDRDDFIEIMVVGFDDEDLHTNEGFLYVFEWNGNTLTTQSWVSYNAAPGGDGFNRVAGVYVCDLTDGDENVEIMIIGYHGYTNPADRAVLRVYEYDESSGELVLEFTDWFQFYIGDHWHMMPVPEVFADDLDGDGDTEIMFVGTTAKAPGEAFDWQGTIVIYDCTDSDGYSDDPYYYTWQYPSANKGTYADSIWVEDVDRDGTKEILVHGYHRYGDGDPNNYGGMFLKIFTWDGSEITEEHTESYQLSDQLFFTFITIAYPSDVYALDLDGDSFREIITIGKLENDAGIDQGVMAIYEWDDLEMRTENIITWSGNAGSAEGLGMFASDLDGDESTMEIVVVGMSDDGSEYWGHLQVFRTNIVAPELEVTLTEPVDESHYGIQQDITITGTVECPKGESFTSIDAYAQILPENGENWIDISPFTGIQTADPNPIQVGTLGGYGDSQSTVASLSYHKEVCWNSDDNTYSDIEDPSSAKVGYEVITGGSGTENLDVSSTTQGTPDQLNSEDTDAVRLKRNKNLVATMSDSSKTGTILTATIYLTHKEASDARGNIIVEAIDSSTGSVIGSAQFSPSASYKGDSFSCPELDSWNEVNNLQIKVTNKVNKDSFIDLIDVVIEYSYYKVHRDYLKFDLSSIPAGSRIYDAQFEFDVNTAGGSANVYSSGDFDSSTSSSTIYSTSNGLVESGVDTSIIGRKTVDVTSEIKNAIKSGQDYYAFQLRETGEDAQFQIDGSVENTPSLTITYAVPYPTSKTVSWFATGLTPGTYQLRILVDSSGFPTSNENTVIIEDE